jgi:hypothetical protein
MLQMRRPYKALLRNIYVVLKLVGTCISTFIFHCVAILLLVVSIGLFTDKDRRTTTPPKRFWERENSKMLWKYDTFAVFNV